MGKIFVVTVGEYDDYHIVGVTTDRAVAERIVELHDDGWYTPDIEEHDDTTAEDIANEKPGWCVDLWDDGRLQAHKQSIPYRPENYHEIFTRINDHVICIVPGETEEEAIAEAKKRRDEHDSNN